MPIRMPAGNSSATASATRTPSGAPIAARMIGGSATMATSPSSVMPNERGDQPRTHARLVDPAAQEAAGARAEQQREQRHRQRVHRVAEQQHEPLQQRHLHQHERRRRAARSRPATTATPCRAATRPLSAIGPRMNSSTSAVEIAISVISALSPLPKSIVLPERDAHLVLQLRGVEEERAVVGGRRDVERVARVERLAVGREDQARVVVRRVAGRFPLPGAGWRQALRRGQPGRVEHRELQVVADLLQAAAPPLR